MLNPAPQGRARCKRTVCSPSTSTASITVIECARCRLGRRIEYALDVELDRFGIERRAVVESHSLA